MAILPTVLPRLQGMWLTLFRALWCIAFAITLFSAIGATWTDARDPSQSATNWQSLAERQFGLGVRLFPPGGAQSWHIVKVFSPEAAASGVRAGDQVLALDGRLVTQRTEAAAIAQSLNSQEGQRTVLRVRSADGAVHDRTLVYRHSNVEAWYRGSGLTAWRQFLLRRIAYDLMTLLLLAVSTILFLRRSHEVVAAAFSLGLCMVPIGPAVEFWAAIDALDSYHILSAIPYVVLLMVGCAFPDGRFWPAWTRFSIIAAPALLLPTIFLASEYSQFTMFAAPGFLAVVLILALRYGRLPQGVERQQYRWAAFGLASGVLLLIARIPYGIFIQGNLSPSPLSPWIDLGGSLLHVLGFVVIGAGFGVALLRYRLYDAESFIGRSAALTAATLLLAGMWAASEKALEIILPAMIGQRQETLAGIISAGLAVVLATSVHGRMHQWIEKRFQKGVYRLRRKLPVLLNALTPRFDTAELCQNVLSEITRDVRATKAAILLREQGGLVVAASHGVDGLEVGPWLEMQNPAKPPEATVEAARLFNVTLPLVDALKQEPIGWLFIGPRPDGTSCNRDERSALASVAAPIASAIATAQARHSREAHLLARLAALEANLPQSTAGKRP